MEALNELKATVQSIRISTESQSYRAAATVDGTSVLFSKSRQITYITTLYESGNYEVAKAKLDELKALPANTDISQDLIDPTEKINKLYNVRATEKTEGAWTAWS